MEGILPADTPLERKSETELAKRLRPGALVHALAVGFFAFGTEFGRANPIPNYAFIAVLSLCAMVRLAACRRVLSSQPDEIIPNARKLHLTFYAQLTVWTAYLGYVFYNAFGQITVESILVICVAGTTSSGSNVLAPNRTLAFVHFHSQILVCLIWSLFAAAHYSAVIVAAVVAYTIVQTVVIHMQDVHTRSMFATQIRLENALEELQTSRDAAERTSQDRARFLANMSHEIRTPLNGLLGLSQILSESRLDAEQSEICGTMQQSGEHLRRIVDDILDYSKAIAGRMELERIPFNLHALVTEITRGTRPLADQKSINFEVFVAPDVPAWVEGDPVRLRQILLNLLGNSVKFTSTGGVRLEVIAVPSQSLIQFAVEDSGIGIAPENLNLLFQDFTQLDNSTKRRFGGTGLGLAITRRLVQLMSGSIEVDSHWREGTRFLVRLPLHPVPRPASDSFRAPLAGNLADFAGSGVRVLVAEDNPVNRRIARAMLEKAGVTVDLAENGAQAVRMHAEQPYHLILMDCNMPEMDGYEATEAIRKMLDPSRNAVPIIALTANAFPEDRERCLVAGMSGHMAKPVRKESLLAILSQFSIATQTPVPDTVPATTAGDAPHGLP
jgi:signal transduction histidine kinase/ActR/RegA family two-component response regulator